MEDKRILVTQTSLPLFEEYVEEISDIWESKWLTNMGAKHVLLEEKLKQYLDTEEISLMCNGHLALEIGIKAMNLSGEVITTPFTFASTTHAIVNNGLKPVFADIDPVTYTIDPVEVEKLITDKTSAIVPVHVYGNICNIKEIDRIAKKYNLKVIYDAAHAFGTKYKGKGIASFGDASMFSFHATKVFSTIEGGAFCFRDNCYCEILKDLKNFGIRGPESVVAVGTNAKMNEFQAAMGLCNLRHLEEEIEKREKVVKHYQECLKDVQGVQLSGQQEGVTANYSYFPIVIHEKEFGIDRNKLVDQLAAHNIFARKYFYPLVNSYECYKEDYCKYKTSNAEYIAERVMTLPLYADLSLDQVDSICDIIKKSKQGRTK